VGGEPRAGKTRSVLTGFRKYNNAGGVSVAQVFSFLSDVLSNMSEFLATCPKCRQRILGETAYVGKRVACPLCLQEITMPVPDSPAESSLTPSPPAASSPGAAAGGQERSVLVMTLVVVAVLLVLTAGVWIFLEQRPDPKAGLPEGPPPVAATSPGTGDQQTAERFNPNGSGSDLDKTYNDPQQVAGGGPLTNGIYKIINRNSGQALDVFNKSTTNNASVDQYPYWRGDCQKWTLTYLGNGQYSIVGVGSRKALNVFNQATDDNATVDIYAYSGDNCQKWSITATSGGYYKVIGAGSGKALEVCNQSTAKSAMVDINPYLGANSQQWAFQAP
jgi:hypothetical protein